MQPSEGLSASAQVAVTLAGFAGVVVAFRSGLVHQWSKIDKFRLRILLNNSGAPFALSIFAMILLSTNLAPTTTWRLCSIIAFVLLAWMGASYRRAFRDFSGDEFRSSGGNVFMMYACAFIAIAATLLQLYNAISLQTFWPFFVAIGAFLLFAMLQFILLVTGRDDQTGDN